MADHTGAKCAAMQLQRLAMTHLKHCRDMVLASILLTAAA